MRVKIKRLHPDAKMPKRGTKYAAGFDLYAAEIVDAVRKYTTVLSAARQSANPAALERVKFSAYMLTHALRDWEAAR